MTSQEKITKIARGVRTWGVRLYNRSSVQGKLQWGYGLEGMCGICSYEMFIRLRKARFRPQIVFGISHAWVLCRGLVVDVTSTQFADLNHAVVVEKFEPIKKRFHVEKRYFYVTEVEITGLWIEHFLR